MSLAIINAHPLEMVIMGEILRSLGYKNTIYNFNRNTFPNSIAKTFEAYLLMVAWKNSSYFQEQAKKIQISIESLNLKIQGDMTFFIFDENNTFVPYEYTKIDTYLKTQIGYKEPKNVYRLDKYPTMDFLLQKGIKKVIAFDNDDDMGGGLEAYKEMILQSKNNTLFIKESYDIEDIKNPGLYEDYLVLKNKEYMTYRQTIEEKTLSSFPGLAEKKKQAETPQYNFQEPYKNKKQKNIPGIVTVSEYEDRSIVPYLVLFPVIFIAFLASDLGAFNPKTSTIGTGSTSTHTSGSSFFYWG